MKVILLEVSHWHFPLYVAALQSPCVDIVGLSDRNPAVRARYCTLFGCPGYADWRSLLADASVCVGADAAFSFGRHAEMPLIGQALVARRLPFAIEKPAGLSVHDVIALRHTAAEAGVPVAVPLVQRIGPLQSLLDDLVASERACFRVQSWRFNAGPPQRYRDAGCDWMLDPASAGGGALINLAVHFVDLAARLMPEPPRHVSAHIANALHRQPVEDTALVTMSAADGSRALIESGYGFPESPEKRDYSFALAGPDHYLRSVPGGVRIDRPGVSPERVVMDLDSDPLYHVFCEGFMADIAAGRPPAPGLGDLEAAMRIIDTAYQSARQHSVLLLDAGAADLGAPAQ